MKKVSDPPDDYYAMALRKRSSEIKSSDPLVFFLYILMRDHLTPGVIEYLMLQLEAEQRVVGGRKTSLTNGWLAQYANDVAGRLHGRIKVVAPKQPRKKKRER